MNKPTYSNKLPIKSVHPKAYVVCPDNPIVDDEGNYNVFFHIRPGSGIQNSYLNSIHVMAEAGGMGSSENAQAFGHRNWIESQLEVIHQAVSKKYPEAKRNLLGLSSFSGGYQAVGQLISDYEILDMVDAVVVLDGIHEGKRGNPDPGRMNKWVHLARPCAEDKNKKFIFLYTAVDPGTYSSTSDAAFYLTDYLGLTRVPMDGYDISFAGVKPATVAWQEGFRAIQLYPRKNDGPGYGYIYKPNNEKGTSGHQHIIAGKCFPDIANRYLLQQWNKVPLFTEEEKRQVLNLVGVTLQNS